MHGEPNCKVWALVFRLAGATASLATPHLVWVGERRDDGWLGGLGGGADLWRPGCCGRVEEEKEIVRKRMRWMKKEERVVVAVKLSTAGGCGGGSRSDRR